MFNYSGEIFPITGVARDDIAQVLGDKVAGKFDDFDMKELAKDLANAYMNVFWIDLKILAEDIAEERGYIERG